MATLIVHNIDDEIVNALKQRAGKHGISIDAEHRKILEAVLSSRKKKSLAQILMSIPDVGQDSDFERIEDNNSSNVFD